MTWDARIHVYLELSYRVTLIRCHSHEAREVQREPEVTPFFRNAVTCRDRDLHFVPVHGFQHNLRQELKVLMQDIYLTVLYIKCDITEK